MSLVHVYVYVCVYLPITLPHAARAVCIHTHTHDIARAHTHTHTEQGSLALSRCNDGVGQVWEILARQGKPESAIPCDFPPEKWAARSLDEKLSLAAEWIKSRVARGDGGKD